jgi:hypothetical protein
VVLAVPKTLMEAYGIVPLRITAGQILYLAFPDQPDSTAAFAMQRMFGVTVQAGMVELENWTVVRNQLRHCRYVDEILVTYVDTKDLVCRVSTTVIGLQPRAARLVRAHHFYWLRVWLEEGAMTSRNGGIPRTTEDVVDCLYVVRSEQ